MNLEVQYIKEDKLLILTITEELDHHTVEKIRRKADYEVEVELNVIIQNESPYTVYEVDVSYAPNQYSEKYTLIDKRENKLQPLEGNKHFDFTLRIMKHYYDVYASDVDQELYRIGKGISPLNGSKLIIKYKDSKHKAQVKTQVLE